jgi:hypothetical protein
VPDPARFTPDFQRRIRASYARFSSLAGKPVIVDKSPQHCYKVPYVHRVFPDAKWVHLVRDGRAVTLSTHKEWLTRRQLAEQRNIGTFVRLARRSLALQPFWRFKAMQIRYWLPRLGGPGRFLAINRDKWGGQVGWGQRFPGWREALISLPLLEFNACQWTEAVRHAQEGLDEVPGAQILTVRYEAFVADPSEVLREICQFLELDCPESYLAALPDISAAPLDKWRQELSPDEQARVEAVLADTLTTLDYELTAATQ